MKKPFLAAMLLLTALASWAFYPKAAESPASLMLVSRAVGTSFTTLTVTLTTIPPDGPPQKWETTTKLGTSLEKQTAALDFRRSMENNRLNELRRQGWHLVHAAPSGPNTFEEMVYVLEK